MADKKEKGKGNGPKIVIIILLAIIVLGLGFGGAYFFLYKNAQGSNTNAAATSAAYTLNQTTPNAANELSSYTYSMDEFLVNLADDGGKRFFKVKLFIGYEPTKKKEKAMLAELEEKKPVIRDAINSILRSKKSTDIAAQNNINDLKKEILTKIAPYIQNGKVTNVYFNDILVQ